MVPQGFSLPLCNAQTMFSLWLRGNAVEKIKPYRYLKTRDLECIEFDTDTNGKTSKKWEVYRSKVLFVMTKLITETGKSDRELKGMDAKEFDDCFVDAYDKWMMKIYPNYTAADRARKKLGDHVVLTVYDKMGMCLKVH